ncbi:MAG TPA: lipopolysaccharide kinase InaA family protein [candidate division Zixibacteria bacterium]|nr:lipopolysaccharide kinase InaA family protein [candidate division Zixibacteria bacterium]
MSARDSASVFVRKRVGSAAVWADPWFARVAPEVLADPDRLFDRTACRIVKDEKKVTIGRAVLAVDGTSTVVYVKRYNAHSAFYRLVSLFRVSAARRALRGAVVLARCGVATARPLAAVEIRRWGMLDKSFFLSQEIPQALTADAYWRESLAALAGADGMRRRRAFLRGVARLFRRLHDARLYHNDLKDANILVSAAGEGERLFLLDFEGVRQCRYLSERRRVKNLVQLLRTLGGYLSATQSLFFLGEYLRGGGSGAGGGTRRRWVHKIARARRWADARSRAKAAGTAGRLFRRSER